MYTQGFTGVCFSLLHSNAMLQCDLSLLCDDEIMAYVVRSHKKIISFLAVALAQIGQVHWS